MPIQELGRVFAYHRDKPLDSQDVEAQIAEYRATAALMGMEFVGCIHEDDAVVRTTPCCDRPGFRKLLGALRPGDYVLVLQEGKSARQVMGHAGAPCEAIVVGVIDHVQIDGRQRALGAKADEGDA